MTDKARRPDESGRPEPTPRRRDPFSLEAYLERQEAEFANGPTMAEILADMDRFRRTTAPSMEDIVETLHESHREREEHLERVWNR